MERRYLVAALAIVATFAVTSHGFRVLQRVCFAHGHGHWSMAGADAMAKAKCESQAASRAVAKLRTHLRPGYAEEAQLLAEMNLPIANMSEKIAERMAKQQASVAKCDRARAKQEAERARRDAQRLTERITRAVVESGATPISLDTTMPSNLDRRIQAKMAAMTARLAANGVKLEIATDKLRQLPVEIEGLDMPMTYVTDDGGKVSTHVRTHVHTNVQVRCNVSSDDRQPQ